MTPPPADDAHDLTDRQLAILSAIQEGITTDGMPPTMRELGEMVGLSSPSSVKAQLDALEAKGYLRRDEGRSRAIHLLRDPETHLSTTVESARNVPLVGEIAAGAPILADERVESVYALPSDLVGDGTLFMLRVRGDSMVEAGVFTGDLVVVREQPNVEQGEMCAALVDGEATVKFFRRTKAGEVFLDPANAGYEPIPVDRDADARVMGKVVAVLRSVR